MTLYSLVSLSAARNGSGMGPAGAVTPKPEEALGWRQRGIEGGTPTNPRQRRAMKSMSSEAPLSISTPNPSARFVR